MENDNFHFFKFLNKTIIIKDIEFNDNTINLFEKWLSGLAEDPLKLEVSNCGKLNDFIADFIYAIPQFIDEINIENCNLKTDAFDGIFSNGHKLAYTSYVSLKNNNLGEDEESLLKWLELYFISGGPRGLTTLNLSNNNIDEKHYTKTFCRISNLIWKENGK